MIATDYAVMLIFAALMLINPAALLPLFILCFDIFMINIFDTDFPRYCVTALMYAEAAKLNIHMPAKLRHAFLGFASLYWVCALDEMLYNHIDTYQGHFYAVMPYLVIALNAYIASVLLMDGGRTIVGTLDRWRCSVINRITWL